MQIKSLELIEDLTARTQQILDEVAPLREKDLDILNWRASENSWSILECLEHLNLYGDFYLPAIEQSINGATRKPAEYFKSGVLGNYFAKSMLPREKLNKMSTFKSKNPIHSQLDKGTISRFLDQQERIMASLSLAHDVDLKRTQCKTTVGIKLRLGDVFRIVIYHNQRHMRQIDRVMSQYNQEHGSC